MLGCVRLYATLGFPGGSAGKESACNAEDLGLIPRLGRSPGEGNGYPLQYSGLENPMDCIVHGVTKSRTWLSDSHFATLWTITCHGLLCPWDFPKKNTGVGCHFTKVKYLFFPPLPFSISTLNSSPTFVFLFKKTEYLFITLQVQYKHCGSF